MNGADARHEWRRAERRFSGYRGVVGRSPLVLFALMLGACEPRNQPPPATATAPSASATAAPSVSAAPKPSTTTAPTWGIPGLSLPGSPRQAIVGKWNVAAVDGKPIASAPGMASDPMDPATYIAGSQVTFTEAEVTLARAGATVLKRAYKVLSETPPFRVTIDAGNGPSNVDFSIDGSALWSLPSTPPHVVSLVRAQ